MCAFSIQPATSFVAPSMEDYKERLRQPHPMTCSEIKDLYTTLFQESISTEAEVSDFLFDKSHSLRSVVKRLYRAVFLGMEEKCLQSTTGASKVIDKETNKVLFYSKMSFLPENLGVPNHEAIEREHLYYLLDHEGFSGVPPTFRVQLTSQKIRSFNWFKKNCCWWCNHTEEKKVSARKCLIHQFRTVNMDPSSPNILTPRMNSSFVFPIDGGYCLPHTLSNQREAFSIADNPPLINKPYLDDPFTEEELTYINNIDIDKDKELISSHLKGKNQVQNVLKIFHVANLILKKAAEQSKKASMDTLSITLHDLCNIRDLRSYQHFPTTSLFEYIMEGVDEEGRVNRTDHVFNEIIRIKTAIHTNEGSNLEQFTLTLLRTIDEKNLAMRRMAARYILGAEGFRKALYSREDRDFEIQLRKIQ